MSYIKLDRTVAPGRFAIQSVPLLDFPVGEIAEQVPTYLVEGGTEDIIKIDFVFKAGTRYEPKPMVAALCHGMLKEGTSRYASNEISEIIDFYGAHLATGLSKDRVEITLLCLKKHLNSLIDIYTDILLAPTFPEKEFESYTKRSKSKLAVNLDKVDFQCRLLFSKMMFGDTGYRDKYSLDNYKGIEPEDLHAFFRNRYSINDAYCVISGKDTAFAKDILDSSLTTKERLFTAGNQGSEELNWDGNQKSERKKKKEGAVQSVIRMGIPAVDRNHPDYAALYLGNVILGGYFGSRLMQNIREEKGFTYGVGSSYQILEHAAYISIATQVGAEHTLAACAEIRNEITRLGAEPVSKEELELVQNYVAGNTLKHFDGPFATADRLKVVVNSNLNPDTYAKFSKELFTIEPSDIQHVMKDYFDSSNLTTAVVGEW